MKDSFLESSAAFVGPVGSEGGRSPSTLSIGQVPAGGLAPGQRWSVGRKREVVLRLLRGDWPRFLWTPHCPLEPRRNGPHEGQFS